MARLNICAGRVVGILLLIGAGGCSVGSVVDKKPDRTKALTDLEFWRYRAATYNPPTEEKKKTYDNVQEGVRLYVDDKKDEANSRAKNVFFGGSVDLRRESIPEAVRRDAASLFGSPGSDVGEDVYVILKDILLMSRQASADELSRFLERRKLPDRPPTSTTAPTSAPTTDPSTAPTNP